MHPFGGHASDVGFADLDVAFASPLMMDSAHNPANKRDAYESSDRSSGGDYNASYHQQVQAMMNDMQPRTQPLEQPQPQPQQQFPPQQYPSHSQHSQQYQSRHRPDAYVSNNSTPILHPEKMRTMQAMAEESARRERELRAKAQKMHAEASHVQGEAAKAHALAAAQAQAANVAKAISGPAEAPPASAAAAAAATTAEMMQEGFSGGPSSLNPATGGEDAPFFVTRMWRKRREVSKYLLMAMAIIVAMSVHWSVSHYIKGALEQMVTQIRRRL